MSEFYVMPSFVTLEVEEISSSKDWYRRALGFESFFEAPGQGEEPALVHLRRGKYQDLLLVPASAELRAEPGRPGKGTTINFSVEEDVDVLAAKAAAVGSRIVAGPVDRPWNVRDVTVEDPDGYRLTFSQVLDTYKDFPEVMEASRRSPGD